MRLRMHRFARGEVDDPEGLSIRNVTSPVGLGFLHNEIVELSIPSVVSLHVESEERSPGALERDELIAERHFASHLLEFLSVERIFVMGAVVVIVSDQPEPYFLCFFKLNINGIVDCLFESSENL
jgi:hypothetical protein